MIYGNISLPVLEKDALETLACELGAAPPLSLSIVSGGGNAAVFDVDSANGRFALKLYASADRLRSESAALTFLSRTPLQSRVARIAAANERRCAALFEWIDGTGVTNAARDVSWCVAFLADLHGEREAPGAAHLNYAAEACLSTQEIVRQVRRRISCLQEIEQTDSALAAHLRNALLPALDRALAALPVPDSELPRSLQTLSPSDFGFHNIRRRPSGDLVCLDFEYFGWDDPVKLVADTLLHPGAQLTVHEQREFLQGAKAIYAASDPRFSERLCMQFPMYALRWSLIVLNEFLPQMWQRRLHAGVTGDWAAIKMEQLKKSAGLLERAQTGVEAGA